jgi:hypothetical protein
MNRCFSVSRMFGSFGSVLGVGLMLGGACAAQQSLKQPVVIPTPQYPYSHAPVWAKSFVVGDLDGDGKPDLLYWFAGLGANAGALHDDPLFNNGDGTFLPPGPSSGDVFTPFVGVVEAIAPVTKGGRAAKISLQSFNGSAIAGVVPYTASRVVGGNATLSPPFTLVGSEAPAITAIAVADVNGDGANDIVALDGANGRLYVLLNDGTGVFTPKAHVTEPEACVQLIVDDFDLDGIPDIAVLGADGRIFVELSDGHGGIKGTRTFSIPGGVSYSMLYADIHGDGLKDLVIEGLFGNLWAILATPGHGPEEGSAAIELRPNNQGRTNAVGGHLVGIADLNGDGIADIVTSTPAGVYVLLGQGSLTYEPSLPYNAGPGRTSYALADFNGDGKLDLAVDSPEGIAILYGNGDGTFQSGHTFDTFRPAFSLALGDFRGAGVLDAAVAVGIAQLSYLRGDGKGNFLLAATMDDSHAGPKKWPHLVAGDFDGDGNLDLAMSADGPAETDLGSCCIYPASDDGMTVLFGYGNGAFYARVAEVPVNSGGHYGMLAAADLNGDGVSDLVNFDTTSVGGYQGGPGARSGSMVLTHEFGVWNDGYPRPYQQLATGYLTQGRSSAPDIVVESLGSSLSFSVQKNDGKGTFSLGQQTFALPSGVAVMTPGSSKLPPAGLYPSALLLTDLDGDGNGDFLVLYHNLAADPAQPNDTTANVLYVFWGNGDGTFVSTPEIVTLSRNYYQMAVADVNGDGKPDLVLSDGYLVSVMAGKGSRDGFAKETHYLAGMGINALAVASVTGPGSSDIVVATGGAVLSAGVVNRGKLGVNGEVSTGGLTVLPGSPATAPVTVTGTLVASPDPVPYDNGFTLTATLTGASGGAVPTGTVTFSVGSTVECTAVAVSNGAAICVPTSAELMLLDAGTYTLTGTYSGDGNYGAATLTGTLTISQIATTTTLVGVLSPIYYGQIIAYAGIEEVSPYPGGGTLDFTINGAVACTITLPAIGTTQYCPDTTGVGYSVGKYIVQSVYSGDTNFLPSSSPAIPVIILPDPTSIQLTSSLNPSTVGQAVTFTASIVDLYAVGQGTVNFFDGTTMIASGTANAQGVATFSTSSLALGSHAITACLVASLNYLASNPCGAVTQMVIAPPPPPPGTFTLAVNPATISVGVGNSVTVQVVVTSVNGISPPVQLACSGRPHETTCTFGQMVIPAGGGSTTLTVSPAAPHPCGVSPPDFVAPNLRVGMAGLLLSVLALLGMRRRRRMFAGMLLVAGLAVLSGLSGCGDKCKDFGTEPTNYQFTVTGTTTGSAPETQAVTVKMDVHL